MAATKHPKTISLNHCWVCSERFTDVDPPGSEVRHDHHLIPRAFGGTDGPTVSICNKHHDILHKIAVALKSKKPYFHLLTNEPKDRVTKLIWMATLVFNAEQATRNDPNKRAMVLLSLDQEQQHMVESLKKVYPRLRSREAIFNAALQLLYSKHFTKD